MMGIGWMELMILIIALLVFLKPEELPRFFRSLGKIYSQIFGTYRQVVREINASDVDYSFNRNKVSSDEHKSPQLILSDEKLKAKQLKEKQLREKQLKEKVFVRPKGVKAARPKKNVKTVKAAKKKIDSKKNK